MDTMEIDDDTYIDRNLFKQDFHRRSRSRCVTMCLGLLCAVLLAGNIGQIIFYEIISHRASTQVSYDALTQDKDHSENAKLTEERDGLQSRFDALASEKKQLQTFLSNLTEEKDRLKQSYSSLTTERDEVKARFEDVKNEKAQLQTHYNQLQKSYNDTNKSLEALQTDHKNLKGSKDQLQTQNSNLQREKNELQNLYTAVVAKRDQLASNYSSLKRDKDQLQRRYGSLTTDRDQLQKNVDKMTAKVKGMRCQENWTKFDTNCYFVSTVKKNWTESRQACIAEGADLIVIDSRDEQVFVNGILDRGVNAWIGLTDSVTEGVWTWVDGTPVTTTYWQPGQPNSYNGNQDCGEFVQEPSQNVGQWNDDGCFGDQNWICEK